MVSKQPNSKTSKTPRNGEDYVHRVGRTGGVNGLVFQRVDGWRELVEGQKVGQQRFDDTVDGSEIWRENHPTAA